MLVVLLLCAVVPTARAKCKIMGLTPSVLTPTRAAIAKDGGILVGALDSDDGELAEGDAARQDGWRIRVGSQATTPTIVLLAPGLAIYKLPPDAKAGVLLDHKRTVVGEVTIAATPPAPLPAPKIKKASYTARTGRRPYARLDIELDKVPAGAIAIVVTDATGKARSWGQIEAGKTTVRGFDRERCQVLANGTVESKPGDSIKVVFVDAGGRKSPPSNAASVTGKAKPDPDD